MIAWWGHVIRQVNLTSSSNLELFDTSEVSELTLSHSIKIPPPLYLFQKAMKLYLGEKETALPSKEAEVTAGSWQRRLCQLPQTYFCNASYYIALCLLVPWF